MKQKKNIKKKAIQKLNYRELVLVMVIRLGFPSWMPSSTLAVKHSHDHITPQHDESIPNNHNRFFPNTDRRILTVHQTLQPRPDQTRIQHEKTRQNPPADPGALHQTGSDLNGLPPGPLFGDGDNDSDARNGHQVNLDARPDGEDDEWRSGEGGEGAGNGGEGEEDGVDDYGGDE